MRSDSTHSVIRSTAVFVVTPLYYGNDQALREVGAWFLFLSPYSPNLNRIEMAFSKLTFVDMYGLLGHFL